MQSGSKSLPSGFLLSVQVFCYSRKLELAYQRRLGLFPIHRRESRPRTDAKSVNHPVTTMNKVTALKHYEAATKIGSLTPVSEWLKAFPTADSLRQFRADVGQISFPEFYGSSPWSAVFSVAYKLCEGFSESSAAFYAKERARGCPYVTGELQVLEAYGLKL